MDENVDPLSDSGRERPNIEVSTDSDRWWNLLLAVITIVTLGVVLVGISAVRDTRDQAGLTRSDTAIIREAIDSVEQSQEVQSCRSAYQVELVGAPQLRALEALGNDDDAAFEEALENADPGRYAHLASLSRTDPDRFLAICRRDRPASTATFDPPATSATTSTAPAPEGAVFESCDDAMAAGVPLPIESGDPGYGPHLDGDADGFACE